MPMRTSSDTCLLCMKNLADQKNSHIIPKFFNKGLFEGTRPRKAYLLGKNKFKKTIQDTVKENYLLCSNCEDKFNTLETYISLRLRKIGDNRYLDDFRIFKKRDYMYYESLNIRPEISQLFWYSLVWRISVSEHLAFSNFKLDIDVENELRKILTNYTQATQSDLIGYLDNNSLLFKYPFVLIRPQKFLRPPQSHMAAVGMGEGILWVNLVDYLLIFYKDLSLVNNSDLLHINLGLDNFKIGVSSKREWINFNKILFRDVGEMHFNNIVR